MIKLDNLQNIEAAAVIEIAKNKLLREAIVDRINRRKAYPIAMEVANNFFKEMQEKRNLTLSEENLAKAKTVFVSYLLWPNDEKFLRQFAKYAKKSIDIYRRYNLVKGEDVYFPSEELIDDAPLDEEYFRMGNEPTLPFVRYEFIKYEELSKAKKSLNHRDQVGKIASDIVSNKNALRMLYNMPLISVGERPLAISHVVWPNDEFINSCEVYRKESNNLDITANNYFKSLGLDLMVGLTRVAEIRNPNIQYEDLSVYDLIKRHEEEANKEKQKKTYAVESPTIPDAGVKTTIPEEEFLYDTEPSSDTYSTDIADNVAKIHELEATIEKLNTENSALKNILERYYAIGESIPDVSEISENIQVNKN